MPTQMNVPARRADGLAVTETVDDVLIYDLARHHIHHLNATVSAVWHACDGTRDLAGVASAASAHLGGMVDEQTARLALTKLADANLLATPLPDDLRVARISRRSLVRRAAIAGAVAVPAIASMTVPAAAEYFAAIHARQSENLLSSKRLTSTCNGLCQTAADCPDDCPTCLNSRCISTCQLDCSYSQNPCKDGDCGFCVSGVCVSAPACGLACGSNTDCAAIGGGCDYCVDGWCTSSAPANQAPTQATEQGVTAVEEAPSPTPTQVPPTPTQAPPTPTPTQAPPVETSQPTDNSGAAPDTDGQGAVTTNNVAPMNVAAPTQPPAPPQQQQAPAQQPAAPDTSTSDDSAASQPPPATEPPST